MKIPQIDFENIKVVKIAQIGTACLILVIALSTLTLGNAVWKKVLSIGGTISTNESSSPTILTKTSSAESTSDEPLLLTKGNADSVCYDAEGRKIRFDASHEIGNTFNINLGELEPGLMKTVLAAAYLENNSGKNLRIKADATGEMTSIIDKVSFSRKGDDRTNYMMAPGEKVALNIWLKIPKGARKSKYGGYIKIYTPDSFALAKITTKAELIEASRYETEPKDNLEEPTEEESSTTANVDSTNVEKQEESSNAQESATEGKIETLSDQNEVNSEPCVDNKSLIIDNAAQEGSKVTTDQPEQPSNSSSE